MSNNAKTKENSMTKKEIKILEDMQGYMQFCINNHTNISKE